jgi:hypothetical protein
MRRVPHHLHRRVAVLEGPKVIRHWPSAHGAAILEAMTTRWIVGVDGSEPSVDALRWAVEHAPRAMRS